jgi:hypothetical protein
MRRADVGPLGNGGKRRGKSGGGVGWRSYPLRWRHGPLLAAGAKSCPSPARFAEQPRSGGFLLLQAQLQNGSIRFQECVNPNCLASKKLFDNPGRKITPVDPDHLGRRSEAFS